jgi:hypothetical protein
MNSAGATGADAPPPDREAAHLDPTSRATATALRNYEREVKFYAQIAPTVDIRVAQCHHAEWHADTDDFVLLLEDLAPGEQGNQLHGCSAEHSRVAVVELARLHGPRWGDPTLDEVEFLRRSGADDAAVLQSFWEMLVPGFLGTYSKYLDSEGVIGASAAPGRLGGAHRILTHGDYRPTT